MKETICTLKAQFLISLKAKLETRRTQDTIKTSTQVSPECGLTRHQKKKERHSVGSVLFRYCL